ncbi:hypothetical protein VPH35_081915 [Triticum aestivum]
MNQNLKILFWNVHGLNCPARRSAVRSMIASVSPSVVCIQESKLADVSPSMVVEACGDAFQDFFILPADGTRGGIILAWRCDEISLSSPDVGLYHVTALATVPGREGH